MAEDVPPPPPMRLLNFVSQDQLEESKRKRGERLEDGTAQRDRPLFEILKENKDKKDAEFNERFKHRPPKALDDDETKFLHKLDMSRKEYERQIADEEALQLRRFQAAVAAQSMVVHEVKEAPVSVVQKSLRFWYDTINGKTTQSEREDQETRTRGKKNQALDMIIKVKPAAKKAKVDPSAPEQPSEAAEKASAEIHQCSYPVTVRTPSGSEEKSQYDPLQNPDTSAINAHEYDAPKAGGLVSYSDESDDD